ncbi:MAG: hypothetical protein Q4C40_00110 [Eubacteriales bacterium]|nr:hypothetical protein [Eubacteriales bacterium]
MSSWRKKFFIAGMIFFVITLIILALFLCIPAIYERLSHEVLCFVPITFDLLATVSFAIFTISRPYTENWFPRTLAVVFIGGVPALVWYAIWFVN